MNMSVFQTLAEILEAIDSYQGGEVYFRTPPPWGLDSECIVLEALPINPNEEDPFDDRHEFAVIHGLEASILVQEIMSVVRNAQLQRPDVNVQTLVEAVNYYYDRDAYMTLD